MRCLPPQVLAMLFQPGIQCRQIRKVWHLLPQPRSGILDVLLDLSLLPAGGGITELGRKDIVVRHSLEPDVDLPFLAAADAIDRGAHIVVDPAPRHTAEDAESLANGR